jgi:hypothetical protein
VTTRERIRSAVGPCVGLDPERQADLVARQVERARLAAPELHHDLKARAAALAREDGTRRLMTEGSIA